MNDFIKNDLYKRRKSKEYMIGVIKLTSFLIFAALLVMTSGAKFLLFK